jgi:hypothetical protein
VLPPRVSGGRPAEGPAAVGAPADGVPPPPTLASSDPVPPPAEQARPERGGAPKKSAAQSQSLPGGTFMQCGSRRDRSLAPQNRRALAMLGVGNRMNGNFPTRGLAESRNWQQGQTPTNFRPGLTGLPCSALAVPRSSVAGQSANWVDQIAGQCVSFAPFGRETLTPILVGPDQICALAALLAWCSSSRFHGSQAAFLCANRVDVARSPGRLFLRAASFKLAGRER